MKEFLKAVRPSVKCDYCGRQANLVKGRRVYPHRNDLSDLNFWHCDNGHDPAYVGCHKKNLKRGRSGIEPLGRLANAKLRNARSMAHKAFDPLWRQDSKRRKFKSRKRAYTWLSEQLKIDASECHIGMFNEEMCGKVVDLVKTFAKGGGARMSEYTINYSVDGWPICKNGEPIPRKKLLLAELQQLQAECERTEAINLGLTKTLVEMEEEKAKLVGALEEALHHVVVSPDPVRGDFIQEIEAALAAYRKED